MFRSTTAALASTIIFAALAGCSDLADIPGPDDTDVVDTNDTVDTDEVVDTNDTEDTVDTNETEDTGEIQCPNVDEDAYGNGEPLCDWSWMDRIVTNVDATNPNVRLAKDITPSQVVASNFAAPIGDLDSLEYPLWDSGDGSGYNDVTMWGLNGTIAVVLVSGTEVSDLSVLIGVDPTVVANAHPHEGVPDVFICLQRQGGVGEVSVGDRDECQRQADAAAAALDASGGGSTVTCYHDWDGDGFGANASYQFSGTSCPSGSTTDHTDCNDDVVTGSVCHPGAPELDDNLDNDCDLLTDEDFATGTWWYRDSDLDGYGNLSVATQSVTQPTGYVANSTDCSDSDPARHPGATEIANDGIDQDCSGADLTAARSAQTIVVQPDSSVCMNYEWHLTARNVTAGDSWSAEQTIAKGNCAGNIQVTYASTDHVIYNGWYVDSNGVKYWLGDSRVSGYESITSITSPAGTETFVAERNDLDNVGYDHDGLGYDVGVLSMK